MFALPALDEQCRQIQIDPRVSRRRAIPAQLIRQLLAPAILVPKVSRIRDDEVRAFMKQVVDRLYTVLLRLDDPPFVERIDRFARRMTRAWDAPKKVEDWFT